MNISENFQNLADEVILALITNAQRRMKIKRKAMIRNRYNYLTSYVQDNKWKEARNKSNEIKIKALKAENQKDSFFPKQMPNGYPK